MTNMQYENAVWKDMFDMSAAEMQPRQVEWTEEERKADSALLAEEEAYHLLLEEMGIGVEYQLHTNGCW